MKFINRFIEVYKSWTPSNSADPLKEKPIQPQAPQIPGDDFSSLNTQYEHLSHKIPRTALEAPGHPMRLIKGIVEAIIHTTQSNSEGEAVITYLKFIQIISRSKHNRILLNSAGFVPPFVSYLRYQTARIQELLADPILKDPTWNEYIFKYIVIEVLIM